MFRQQAVVLFITCLVVTSPGKHRRRLSSVATSGVASWSFQIPRSQKYYEQRWRTISIITPLWPIFDSWEFEKINWQRRKWQHCSSVVGVYQEKSQPSKWWIMVNSDFTDVHRSTSADASRSQQLCALRMFLRITRVVPQKTSVDRRRPMQNDGSLNAP